MLSRFFEYYLDNSTMSERELVRRILQVRGNLVVYLGPVGAMSKQKHPHGLIMSIELSGFFD